MPDPNIHSPRWDAELDDAPFKVRALQAGAHAGARELGATLYEIAPGGAVSPYHVHHGNEELLVVLSGTPRLRTPAGVRELEPGAVVAFVRGPDGAHRVSNASAEPARVLLVSTMNFPEIAEHVDTGAVLAMTAAAAGHVFPSGTDRPAMDMVLEAMEAAGEHEEGPS